MQDEIAIRVSDVSKVFKLPHEKQSSIKGMVTSLGRRNKSYEMQQALKDISFDVKKGEFFGIVGRNGSGKSTLLKLLAGIYTPTTGDIQVTGRLTPFIELGVGFNPELTGRENVYLNGALLGFSRKEMKRMYQDIVEFAELEKFMDQKLKNYSSGMQVRLAFSIAIRAQTDILLVDEVLAVGDAAFQKKCYDYFKDLKANKKTVVFISHDMGAIKQFCDRTIAIEAGVISCKGTNREVTNYYKNLLLGPKVSNAKLPRRLGNNSITINNIKARDSSGKIIHKISSDQPFSITFDYDNPQKIEESIFGVGIFNDRDINIIGPNTKQSLNNMVKMKENGSVKCSFGPLHLAKGVYDIVVSCFNEDETIPYEFVENALTLEVLDNESYGVIVPNCKWDIT